MLFPYARAGGTKAGSAIIGLMMSKEHAPPSHANAERTATNRQKIAAAFKTYSLCAALAGLVGCLPAPPAQPPRPTTIPAGGQNTLGGGSVSGGSVNGQPGQTAAVPITFHLSSGTNVAFFAVTFTVVAQGGAPAITTALSYQAAITPAPDLQSAVQSQGKLAIGYAGATISPPLSGTVQVGTLRVPIPAGATGSYQVQLSKISAGDSSGRKLTLTGQTGTITVRAGQ